MKKPGGKHWLGLMAGTGLLAAAAFYVLNAPLPVPKTANEVHTWPVPKQSTLDLIRSDWFKDAQSKPAVRAADVRDRILGCWKYRNGRMGSFEGSFVVRSAETDNSFSGFWNFDKGHALPLTGHFLRGNSGPKQGELEWTVVLKNTAGDKYGHELLLRGDAATPYLCKLKSDPYAGSDFRAVKTSIDLRPTAPALTEGVQPRTVSMLSGRWHEIDQEAARARNEKAGYHVPGQLPVQYEINRIFDDGTFAIKHLPYFERPPFKQNNGGFIADGQEINLFIEDQAFQQLQLSQSGADITLNDAADKPVLVKDRPAPNETNSNKNQTGSMWTGLLHLIEEHNRQ